jgi:hypothetical protein
MDPGQVRYPILDFDFDFDFATALTGADRR